MSELNILHVIDTLDVGGAEKMVVNTVNELTGCKHHVIYLCGKDQLVENLPADCRVTKLNFTSKLDVPRCVIAIRRYIRKNRIDVVHSHLVMSNLIARLACPREVQLFNSIHSMVGSRCFAPGKRWQRWLEKITYKKRHHIIAVSENVKADYNHSIGIKGGYTVLPNFVDQRFFANGYKQMSFNGTFRMAAVGNLKPAKNYGYLIEAFKQLPKGIHLDIYGEGPLRDELQQQINEHKLNIRLCGLKDNVHEILKNYDMFVMSSLFEGHPIALLEAMACGMPAIVSDIPVLREATANKGIYCDLNDTRDFIEKVKAIAAHEVDLNPYARMNYELVRNIAGKEQYMQTLYAMYSSHGNVTTGVTQPVKSQPDATIFRPALNLQAS